MWAFFFRVTFILQNLSYGNNTEEEQASLLHSVNRQFQYIMNKSKDVYFLQTSELQKAIHMWFALPQSNVTHVIDKVTF